MRDIVGLMIIVNLTYEKNIKLLKLVLQKLYFLNVLLVDWGLAFKKFRYKTNIPDESSDD